MNDTTSRRAVLVSGCSSDFGFRAARALARAGHTVVAGLREPNGRGQRRAEALSTEPNLTCVALDVDDEASVYAAIEGTLDATDGHLHTLVNTAAYSVLGPLEACTPDQLLAMFNTNVVGALRLFRAVLPLMRAQKFGRIIQLTSGLGRAPLPFMGPYSASAWAQECFAEVLSYEAAAFGIDVAILEPSGYRDGGRPKKAVGDADRLEPYQPQLVALAERLISQNSASGDPEEVARAVLQLVEAKKVPLRTAVGDDARTLLELRRTLTADEYEHEIMRRAGLSS